MIRFFLYNSVVGFTMGDNPYVSAVWQLQSKLVQTANFVWNVRIYLDIR